MEISNDFAQQLRSLREAQGLSIRALADLVGVSKVTIWKWERGDNEPRDRLIVPLARALDVMPVQLRSSVNSAKVSPGQVMPDAEGHVRPIPPGPVEGEGRGSPEGLTEVIARAKQMIAEASGVTSKNITISIEY